MSKFWTKNFWKDTTERAISTAAQAALLIIGADQFNIVSVDWPEVLGFAAGGAVLTVLKAVAAGKDDTASAVRRRAEYVPGDHAAGLGQ